MHCNGLKLNSVLEKVFYHSTIFGSKNTKINFFEENKLFSAALSNSSTGDYKPA